MNRALPFCGGVLLGLVAEAIMWKGPDLYAYEETWSKELTRIAGLGLIAQGAVTAAGAALCLARAFVPLSPGPSQNGRSHSGPAAAAVRRPLLPICGMLFFLGAAGPFWQARDAFETLQVMESVPDGYSRGLIEDFRSSGQVALTFGILYSIVGAALLVAPMLLNWRGWQLGQRINGAGCGIAIVGLSLSAVGVFVWFVNGLLMEGRTESISRVGSFGVLGGTVLAVVGSIMAVVGRQSHTGEQQRDARQNPRPD